MSNPVYLFIEVCHVTGDRIIYKPSRKFRIMSEFLTKHFLFPVGGF